MKLGFILSATLAAGLLISFIATDNQIYIRIFVADIFLTFLVWFNWHMGKTPLHTDETSYRPRFSRNMLPEVHFSFFKRGGIDNNLTDNQRADQEEK